jgi:hypothetical protein
MINNDTEYILCAAIWYKELPLVKEDIPSSLLRPVNCATGIVFCGFRHPHCLYQLVAITGMRSVKTEVGDYSQGFLTSRNRFVDRREAAKIAIASGQILKTEYEKGVLFSEDIY